MRKGWGPGALLERTRNPAGPDFPSFDEFLGGQPAQTPFCFWFGAFDPHRPYDPRLGELSGIDPAGGRGPALSSRHRRGPGRHRQLPGRGAAFRPRAGRGTAAARRAGPERSRRSSWSPATTAGRSHGPRRTPTTPAHACRWRSAGQGGSQPGTVINRLTVLTDLAPTFLRSRGPGRAGGHDRAVAAAGAGGLRSAARRSSSSSASAMPAPARRTSAIPSARCEQEVALHPQLLPGALARR